MCMEVRETNYSSRCSKTVIKINRFVCKTFLQLRPLVPIHQFDILPSYYIFAGLVFTPLSQPYLQEYGEDWYNTSPRRLCERALSAYPTKPGQQLVILSQVKIGHLDHGFLGQVLIS